MLTTRRDVVTPLNASGFVVMGFAGRRSGGGRGVHDGDNIHPCLWTVTISTRVTLLSPQLVRD